MKKLIIILLLALILSGCGTISGVGSLLNGIGSDLQNGSEGYSKERSR